MDLMSVKTLAMFDSSTNACFHSMLQSKLSILDFLPKWSFDFDTTTKQRFDYPVTSNFLSFYSDFCFSSTTNRFYSSFPGESLHLRAAAPPLRVASLSWFHLLISYWLANFEFAAGKHSSFSFRCRSSTACWTFKSIFSRSCFDYWYKDDLPAVVILTKLSSSLLMAGRFRFAVGQASAIADCTRFVYSQISRLTLPALCYWASQDIFW